MTAKVERDVSNRRYPLFVLLSQAVDTNGRRVDAMETLSIAEARRLAYDLLLAISHIEAMQAQVQP